MSVRHPRPWAALYSALFESDIGCWFKAPLLEMQRERRASLGWFWAWVETLAGWGR